MSTKSIDTVTRESYLKKAEESLLRMSDAYFYKKKFLIGDGIDEDKQSFYMHSHRYLATDSCEMAQFIKDKIYGNLEDCENESPSQVIREFTPRATITTQQVSKVCEWNEVEW